MTTEQNSEEALELTRMKQAGSLYYNMSFTDGQLTEAIRGIRMVLAFMRPLGEQWSLATCKLRQDLARLESFQESRQRNREARS